MLCAGLHLTGEPNAVTSHAIELGYICDLTRRDGERVGDLGNRGKHVLDLLKFLQGSNSDIAGQIRRK